jgi:hypothetical protein
MRALAKDYLLEPRMFRSLRTGKVIDKGWLRFSFPTVLQHDVLRGLDYLRNAGIKPDSSVNDAIEVVIERFNETGKYVQTFKMVFYYQQRAFRGS